MSSEIKNKLFSSQLNTQYSISTSFIVCCAQQGMDVLLLKPDSWLDALKSPPSASGGDHFAGS